MKKRKCFSCGTKVTKRDSYCPTCGKMDPFRRSRNPSYILDQIGFVVLAVMVLTALIVWLLQYIKLYG